MTATFPSQISQEQAENVVSVHCILDLISYLGAAGTFTYSQKEICALECKHNAQTLLFGTDSTILGLKDLSFVLSPRQSIHPADSLLKVTPNE